MASKAAKVLIKKIEALGYRFDRVNSKERHVYVMAGRADVSVNPGISDRDARFLAQRLDKEHGIERETNKRNALALKERRAEERRRIREAMDRLDAERAELIRRKELLPTGDYDQMSRRDRLAIEREIERVEREHREWVRLMTQMES